MSCFKAASASFHCIQETSVIRLQAAPAIQSRMQTEGDAQRDGSAQSLAFSSSRLQVACGLLQVTSMRPVYHAALVSFALKAAINLRQTHLKP